MRSLSLILWLTLQLSLAAAGISSRPIPAKGPGTRTLLVFNEAHTAYSLMNSLELVKLQLGRIDTTVQTVSLLQLTPEQLTQCDFLVVLSLDPRFFVPTNLLAAITSSAAPVFWVGPGLNWTTNVPALRSQFEVGAPSEMRSADSIRYRGKEWNVGPFAYRQFHSRPNNAVQPVVSVATATKNGQRNAQPLCWKVKQFTFFAAEPENGALGFVFEDLLLDFFGVTNAAPNAAFLRVTGYNAQSDHRQFRRVADYLYAHSIPFGVSVRDAAQLAKEDSADFAASLRYAQQRGGRIIIGGSEGRASGPEFWDQTADRPRLQMPAGGIRRSITGAAAAALDAGLLPIAWQTPQNAASSYAYKEVAAIFGTAVERVQLSDATSRDNYAPGGLVLDAYGRLIVPENLGFIPNSSNGLAAVKSTADLLANLRGTILSSSFDAYLPFARLVQLVDLLESYRLPFLDLAEVGNRVELPDKVLLTGNAAASVRLQNATIRWKTFSRGGQLLAEDQQRNKVTGQREFKRIGIGVYELVQFTNESSK